MLESYWQIILVELHLQKKEQNGTSFWHIPIRVFAICFSPVNPFTLSGVFFQNSSDRSISNSLVCGLFLLLLYFIEISAVTTNSVDPDQMPFCDASSGSALLVNYHFRGLQAKHRLIIIQSILFILTIDITTNFVIMII